MKRPGAVTSRDPAEPGYSASGASEHSRHAAHSQNIKLPGYSERTPKIRGPRSGSELVRENVKALAKLERDARRETNPVRRAKLEKNIKIKKRFIEKIGGNEDKQITGRSAARTGRVVEDGVIRDEETGARVSFSKSATSEEIGRGDIVDYVARGREAFRIWMNVKLLPSEMEI